MGLALLLAAAPAAAQQSAPREGRALPSAEEVLAGYHAAAGGRERLAAIRDGVFEWRTESGGRPLGTAVSRRMVPGSLLEQLANGAVNVNAPSLTWRRRPDGTVMVDSSAGVVRGRLQASLEASYLVGLAQQGITARVTGADSVDGELAYRVEFGRGGATRTYLMGATSRLPLRILLDEARGIEIRYGDYRPVEGVMEAHRVEIAMGGGNSLVFLLASARHNTGLTDRDFLPPSAVAP
jgi:hypothetical protein